MSEKSSMLFKEWKELFRLAHDDKSKQKAVEERRSALEEVVGEKFKQADDEYMSLFALQTTYSIIVKIIAFKVISKLRFDTQVSFNNINQLNFESLGRVMNDLESGGIFRNLGILNLLEGDFFSWYSSEEQWNDLVSSYIKEIFIELKPYENKIVFTDSLQSSDLFRELFMSIMPDKVRHSLGEYYTPSWLADELIEEAISMLETDAANNWRALDPCAGSGTFVILCIQKIINASSHLDSETLLFKILNRVKAIDLNPIAVLTCRVNYFISISPLVTDNLRIEIPVYLGDSSNLPKSVSIDGVECLEYSIQTLQGNIDIALPHSTVSKSLEFADAVTSIEKSILLEDQDAIIDKLSELTDSKDLNSSIRENFKRLADRFIQLERNNWDGIWPRILSNFMAAATLGKFDLIVGNPPWIDWKNLPAGYRERVKSLCISRHLFSGDRMVGGINLNICGLITNVVAGNYLSEEGVLAFYMPKPMIFQQTYEGFRSLQSEIGPLFFKKFIDWDKAGKPFDPVSQKFLSYFIQKGETNYREGIPYELKVKKRGIKLSKYRYDTNATKIRSDNVFTSRKKVAGQVSKSNSIFSIADDRTLLHRFSEVVGKSHYKGREGIEFYPQELFLFTLAEGMPEPPPGNEWVTNFQSSKSKYNVAQQTILMETKYLHPLVKGKEIGKFDLAQNSFYVPFPYDKDYSFKAPLPLSRLRVDAPNLTNWLMQNRSIIEAQTDYNQRIIGKNNNQSFYALARVGKYSFGEISVAFRDNSKWGAVVVESITTTWGEKVRPQFQNHAVSISQDGDGNFIDYNEAHFICGILNAPTVSKYIAESSDSRSFKIRPQINIPKFDRNSELHNKIVILSQLLHSEFSANHPGVKELDELVLKMNKFAEHRLPRTAAGSIA